MTSYVMCNKKKLGIKKSDIECLKKSVEDRKLEYFKSELLKILDKKEKEESGEEVSKAFIVQELYKSMTDPLYMAKGGKVGVVGEIRTWNGKKYKKMPNKKWVRIYDTHDKHTEISIARLKGKVRNAQSVDELFEIVMNNTHRFSDENGKPLDIVLELKKEVDARKKALNAGKPSTKEQIEKIKKEQKKQDYNDVNKKDKESERAEAVKKHIEDKLNEYMNDSYTKSSAYGFVKKYGKARLEKIADGKIKSDEEYKKWLNDRIADIEKERGENVSDYTIDTAIWKHCVAFYEREAAREKLKSMDANEKTPDLPVDEKDMQEAKNIIGADVKRILDGRDTYGNAKQTLTDKIKRRIRNNPGVARAMLVYIKQEQEKTGKKVYTEKHSIWEELPKLNENAKEALKNGESETKTGVSGNLYEGDDGTTVVENKDWGRYQISFPGKPDSETISMLKHNGFRWSPKTQTWVCFNTSNGEYSLKRVAEKLGLKKTGDVKKSFTSRINELKKSFFDSIGA